jgi:hypothetical protein
MYRKIFKFAVTTLTILTVNLLVTIITNYLISYKTHYKPITFTIIAMGIICLIFYPLFTKLEDWINVVSAKIVKAGKSVGGKYLGLFIMYFVWLYYYIFLPKCGIK